VGIAECNNNYIIMRLDNDVNYLNNTVSPSIRCANAHPYKTYLIGDQIEINNYITRYYKSTADVYFSNNDNIIRKLLSSVNTVSASGSSSDISISPSAVNAMKSPGTMEIAREMSRMVDETGKNWEYKIEVASQDGKTISHSLICRKN